MGFSRQEWATLFVVGTTNIFDGVSVSIQAPFYPAEAEKKGATATEYGLVFGSYVLVKFLISPLIGKYVEKYGFRLFLIGGIILSSISIILFGLLEYVQDRALFISLSIILRVAESVGAISASIAGSSLIGIVFSSNYLGSMLANMQSFNFAGCMIAPAVGGFLYAVGGFPLPFIFIGIIGFITAALIHPFIPPYRVAQTEKQKSVTSVMKDSSVAFNTICCVMFASTWAFTDVLLEPHLRQFNLSPQTMPLYFLIMGSAFTVGVQLTSRLVKYGVPTKTLMITGCIFVIQSFAFLGPAPFIPFKATTSGCILALLIQGFAMGIGVATAYTNAFRLMRRAYTLNDFQTERFTGIVYGIMSSAGALGSLIGFNVACILFDLCGFRWATCFVSCTFTFLLCAVIHSSEL